MQVENAGGVRTQSVAPYCNIVPVGFANGIPQGMPIAVTRIEAEVVYRDGSRERLGPKTVNIPPFGNDEVMFTACTAKCAQAIQGWLTVTDSRFSPPKVVTMTKTRTADTATACLTAASFPVGPAKQVDQASLEAFHATGDLAAFFTIE